MCKALSTLVRFHICVFAHPLFLEIISPDTIQILLSHTIHILLSRIIIKHILLCLSQHTIHLITAHIIHITLVSIPTYNTYYILISYNTYYSCVLPHTQQIYSQLIYYMFNTLVYISIYHTTHTIHIILISLFYYINAKNDQICCTKLYYLKSAR